MNAKGIIKEVLRDRRIGEVDFFSKYRDGHLVAARMEAARRLREVGYTVSFIARSLKRNHTTILYYLDGKYHARKAETYRKRRVLQFLDPVAKAVVIETAMLEDTTPEVIIAQWVNERAGAELDAKLRDAA